MAKRKRKAIPDSVRFEVFKRNFSSWQEQIDSLAAEA